MDGSNVQGGRLPRISKGGSVAVVDSVGPSSTRDGTEGGP